MAHALALAGQCDFGVFVLAVGASRPYLGVHYPSDILAGWGAALAWVVGVYATMFGFRPAQPFGR